MRARSVLALCAVLTLTACGQDSVGLEPEGTGSLRLRLSQPSASAFVANVAGTQAREDVDKVMVTLTAVSALRTSGDEDNESNWVRIAVEPAVTLDLMNLPTTAETAVLLPRGDLAEGTYRSLRLHVSDATIQFTKNVQVGPRTWAAGEAHPLRIPPQTEQSRIKIPNASFTIQDGASTEINLVMQPGTSVQSIAATPNFILMAPVLLAKPRN